MHHSAPPVKVSHNDIKVQCLAGLWLIQEIGVKTHPSLPRTNPKVYIDRIKRLDDMGSRILLYAVSRQWIIRGLWAFNQHVSADVKHAGILAALEPYGHTLYKRPVALSV